MDDDEIDKLGKFYSIMDIGAKMGGTKPFDRFAPYVTKAMNDFADELDEKYGDGIARPQPAPPTDAEPAYQQESQDLPDVPTGVADKPPEQKTEEEMERQNREDRVRLAREERERQEREEQEARRREQAQRSLNTTAGIDRR